MFKRIIGWLGWVVLAAITSTVAFVLVTVRQGWEFDAVLSGSMEPALNVGGVVVIRPVDISTLGVGDVISFKLPGIDTPICHRIISIEQSDGESYFTTKGDSNEEADQNPVVLSNVKGKAIFHLPYVGRLSELRRIGTKRISLLGLGLPQAVVAVFSIGILFIGLTLKELMDDILHPGKALRQKVAKARLAQAARRKKLFNPA